MNHVMPPASMHRATKAGSDVLIVPKPRIPASNAKMVLTMDTNDTRRTATSDLRQRRYVGRASNTRFTAATTKATIPSAVADEMRDQSVRQARISDAIKKLTGIKQMNVTTYRRM